MKRMGKGVLLLLAATAALAAGSLSERELKAIFYYDLGPDSVDVSGYPKVQQDEYKLFADKCAQCHTLARPINSPLTTSADWRRFVNRMHTKIRASSKNPITAADEKAIVEFLTYDSRKRKIDDKAGFAKQTAALKARFEEVKKERAAQRASDDSKNVKPAVNENAQPTPRP